MAEQPPGPVEPHDEKVIPLKEAKARRDRAAKAPKRKPNGAGNGVDHAPDALTAPPLPLDDDEFRCLGYDHGTFFFLGRRSGQIVPLTASALSSEGNLLELAPLDWWEAHFPKKGGFVRTEAVNALISACLEKRVFDIGRVRGRGAWWDDGRAILHIGDALVLDGRRYRISGFQSRYIYEEAASFDVLDVAPLANADAPKLLKLCEHLMWERPYMAHLLAGWCVVAPICGALLWRPHLWIIGESGSGKSVLQDRIIKPALAGIALCVQSKTTEAGIRQALKSDARPVLFDEGESETPSDRSRMQSVIDLARAASTEGGAPIAKGGQTGIGHQYQVRSAMCFLSIAPMLTHQADENRFTVLRLLGQSDHTKEGKAVHAEHFARLEGLIATTITTDFPSRLLARSIELMPTIRHNALAFARAAAEVMPSRRNADQIGVLLAGAAALEHGDKLTAKEAVACVLALGWIDEAAIEAAREPDHVKLITYLCQQVITVRPRMGAPHDLSIGELIGGALENEDHDIHLRRIGIRVDRGDGHVWFANTHQGLANLLAASPWAGAWAVILGRHTYARKSDNPVRYTTGTKTRAIGIPYAIVTGQATEL